MTTYTRAHAHCVASQTDVPLLHTHTALLHRQMCRYSRRCQLVVVLSFLAQGLAVAQPYSPAVVGGRAV
jgi:hypothetical protein